MEEASPVEASQTVLREYDLVVIPTFLWYRAVFFFLI